MVIHHDSFSCKKLSKKDTIQTVHTGTTYIHHFFFLPKKSSSSASRFSNHPFSSEGIKPLFTLRPCVTEKNNARLDKLVVRRYFRVNLGIASPAVMCGEYCKPALCT
ncbi:hypothetical protein AVEN_83266-1 [Araneus ventricosus]|uniref:Uncharacterized protein n=1 Tax=Araneus ventricosus TaxID=182803 RepID=A0A4Y2I904_ARAVE|nr:hypothetical protein AVEN_83266-1 [Araneus ventricosus]